MSTSARSRRTSQAPESRYETWTRGEITTNNAPDWYEVPPTEWRSSRSNYTQNTPRRSEVAFNSPTVSPSDSISKVPTRRDDGKYYATESRRGTSVSSRRPPMRARYSSDDGTSWSRSQPLTENNLEAFNEAKSRRSRRSDFTAKSSRRPSKRASNAWNGEQVIDERNVDQTPQRGSRHRSTHLQDDYVTGSQTRSRSVRDQPDYDAGGSQARSRSVRDQPEYYASQSRARSRTLNSHPESSLATEAIAAAAAGNAMMHNTVPPRSRAATHQHQSGQTNVPSRRSSQAPSANQNRAMTKYQSTQAEGFDTQIQTRTPSSSSSSKHSPPRELAQPMGPSSPAEMEWERRVHIREYRRPRDGKLVQDRECIVRKFRPPQASRMTGAVQA